MGSSFQVKIKTNLKLCKFTAQIKFCVLKLQEVAENKFLHLQFMAFYHLSMLSVAQAAHEADASEVSHYVLMGKLRSIEVRWQSHCPTEIKMCKVECCLDARCFPPFHSYK